MVDNRYFKGWIKSIIISRGTNEVKTGTFVFEVKKKRMFFKVLFCDHVALADLISTKKKKEGAVVKQELNQ